MSDKESPEDKSTNGLVVVIIVLLFSGGYLQNQHDEAMKKQKAKYKKLEQRVPLAQKRLDRRKLDTYNLIMPHFGLKPRKKLTEGSMEALSALMLIRQLQQKKQPLWCANKKRRRITDERIAELEKLVLRLNIRFKNTKTGTKTGFFEGAGTLYTENGFLFTAAHVLEHKKGWEVDWKDSYASDYKGKKYKFHAYYTGKKYHYDLAFARVRREGSSLPLFCISRLRSSREIIHSFYREADRRYIRMTGMVKRTRVRSTWLNKYGRVKETFLVKNLGRQGHSGSAVFNAFGELIGVDSYCNRCYGKKGTALSSQVGGVARIEYMNPILQDAFDEITSAVKKDESLGFLR